MFLQVFEQLLDNGPESTSNTFFQVLKWSFDTWVKHMCKLIYFAEVLEIHGEEKGHLILFAQPVPPLLSGLRLAQKITKELEHHYHYVSSKPAWSVSRGIILTSSLPSWTFLVGISKLEAAQCASARLKAP